VYQAMRVTGSGDPRTSIDDTLPGKLPQRKITTEAAQGYSSYGNQIGLATGQVAEIYDEDFVAKRMEIGAVIGAAPRKNVKREKPKAGDVIILLGEGQAVTAAEVLPVLQRSIRKSLCLPVEPKCKRVIL